MIKILFVCLGNICRSPAAEAIMNHLLKEHHLNHQIVCDSAGLTTTFQGQPADSDMQMAAADRGYDIHHTARQITLADFENHDFILAMTDEIALELQILSNNPRNTEKIYKLCEFCELLPDTEVLDPYMGDSEEFEFVIDLLEDACNGLLKLLKKKIN